MKNLIRSLSLSAIILLTLVSCSFSNNDAQTQIAQATPTLAATVINLTVQVDSLILKTVGQVVKYSYAVKNAGAASVPGPITVTGAVCPEVTTVGNLDAVFDVNETLICTSEYTVTQADLDKGSVTIITTATVNGINSTASTTTVSTTPPAVLNLTKTANPVSYDRVGQAITYTYVIMNSGAAILGPAQFTVTDTGISAPINCGDAATNLAPGTTVSCSASYTVTQADMAAASVATSAIASGGGAAPSQPASATITKSSVSQSNSNPANLTVGSTIKHQVVEGEWLWQIARCYGADPRKVSDANLPNPEQISPNTTVTVPNIGSVGKIYGPPCVVTHTVQAGDTWSSIALKYNADSTVLQMVNAKTMPVGSVLIVPLNSAGGVTTTPVPTGSANTCVDLTRSIKLAIPPTGTTHFNICGQTDALGNMKIATVKVYQRPEDVGQGGLLQDITVSVETSTPLNDPSLIIGDMNYDGNDDFRIIRNLPASGNIPYLYYIYDPATRTFVYGKAYENITSPEFPGNFEVRSKWRESASKSGIDTYTIVSNIPRLSKRETWEAINTTQAKHQVTVFNADGTSQVTIDELISLPIP